MSGRQFLLAVVLTSFVSSMFFVQGMMPLPKCTPDEVRINEINVNLGFVEIKYIGDLANNAAVQFPCTMKGWSITFTSRAGFLFVTDSVQIGSESTHPPDSSRFFLAAINCTMFTSCQAQLNANVNVSNLIRIYMDNGTSTTPLYMDAPPSEIDGVASCPMDWDPDAPDRLLEQETRQYVGTGSPGTFNPQTPCTNKYLPACVVVAPCLNDMGDRIRSVIGHYYRGSDSFKNDPRSFYPNVLNIERPDAYDKYLYFSERTWFLGNDINGDEFDWAYAFNETVPDSDTWDPPSHDRNWTQYSTNLSHCMRVYTRGNPNDCDALMQSPQCISVESSSSTTPCPVNVSGTYRMSDTTGVSFDHSDILTWALISDANDDDYDGLSAEMYLHSIRSGDTWIFSSESKPGESLPALETENGGTFPSLPPNGTTFYSQGYTCNLNFATLESCSGSTTSDGVAATTESAAGVVTIAPEITTRTITTEAEDIVTTVPEPDSSDPLVCTGNPPIDHLDDSVDCNATGVYEMCEFECDDDFIVSGEPFAHCDESGEWNTSIGFCVSEDSGVSLRFEVGLSFPESSINVERRQSIEAMLGDDSFLASVIETVATILEVETSRVRNVVVVPVVRGVELSPISFGRRLVESDETAADEEGYAAYEIHFDVMFAGEADSEEATDVLEAALETRDDGTSPQFFDSLLDELLQRANYDGPCERLLRSNNRTYFSADMVEILGATNAFTVDNAMRQIAPSDSGNTCACVAACFVGVLAADFYDCDGDPHALSKRNRSDYDDYLETVLLVNVSNTLETRRLYVHSNDSDFWSDWILMNVIGACLLLCICLVFVYVRFRRARRKEEMLVTRTTMQAKMIRDNLKDIQLLQEAWRIPEDDIELCKAIASGSFGTVWYGMYKNSTPVAVKVMRTSDNDDEEEISLEENEIKFLMRTRHARLCTFYGCGVREKVDGSLFIVLEYAAGGSLDRWTWDAPAGGLPWTVRLSLLKDCAAGLRYLHEVHGAVHRDFKSPNVLLVLEKKSQLWRAKVSDFGFSKIVHVEDAVSQESQGDFATHRSNASELSTESAKGSDSSTKRTENSFSSSSKSSTSWSSRMDAFVGTPSWMAPECMSDAVIAKYGPPADIYSFGVCCFEILAQKKPWVRERDMKVIFDKVRAGRRPVVGSRTESGPKGFRALMEECWDSDPVKRPDAAIVGSRLDAMIRELRSKQSRADRKSDEEQLRRVVSAVIHFDVPKANSSDTFGHWDAEKTKRIFRNADSNGDGFLSLREFRSIFEASAPAKTVAAPSREPDNAPPRSSGEIELGKIGAATKETIIGTEPEHVL